MNILDIVMNASGGTAVRQVGSQMGLGEDQTAAALSALLPALAAGLKRNLQTPDGAASVASALSSGRHERYVNNPAILTEEATVTDGNGILGHVLGSKEVSREVASRAAAQTGLSADVLKRLLPIAATLMMGALSQQKATTGATGGGLGDLLSSFIDRDRDGSIVDDLGGMLGGTFRS